MLENLEDHITQKIRSFLVPLPLGEDGKREPDKAKPQGRGLCTTLSLKFHLETINECSNQSGWLIDRLGRRRAQCVLQMLCGARSVTFG